MHSNILICGGGNGAHAMAAMAKAAMGREGRVGIYAPYGNEAALMKEAMLENGGIEVVESDSGNAPREVIDLITADPAEAASLAGMALIVAPAFAHEAILESLAPFLPPQVVVGAIPARSGFEFSAPYILKKHNVARPVIAVGQTLPWACRLLEFGKRVRILGRKNSVGVAAMPSGAAGEVAAALSRFTGVSFFPVDNVLAVSLGNVGQIIHPGIMYGLFRDWSGCPLSDLEVPLFYQGVNEEICNILERMSGEIMSICSRIQDSYPGRISLRQVQPLFDWLISSYPRDIEDHSSLKQAFKTNRAYTGLKAPVKPAGGGGYTPDFSSRYLTEDVPTGLVVTRALAQLCGVPTPAVDEVIAVTGAWMRTEYLAGGRLEGRGVPGTRVPWNYGLHDLESVIAAVTGPGGGKQ